MGTRISWGATVSQGLRRYNLWNGGSIDLVFGALEAIIIQINKGKEYGLKSKRVGKNLGFFLPGLYWWLRCKAIRSRVEKRGKLAICIQGRLPHLQEVFLFFPSRLFRTSPPMFFFLKRTSDDYHLHIFLSCNYMCLKSSLSKDLWLRTIY